MFGHAGNGEEVRGELGGQGTHMDALGHFGFINRPGEAPTYFGGLTQSEVVSPTGLNRLGIDKAEPIITSVVMQDAARYLNNENALAPGYAITRKDIETTLSAQRLAHRGIKKGDVVFIHTGYGATWDGTSRGCTYNTDRTPSGILYAMTWSAKMIGINTVLLDLFETVFPEPEPDTDVHYARTVGFRRQVIEVVEGTILHEMVHWSYFVTGKDEEKLHGGDKEHGTKNFEMEAYGNYLSLPHSRLCANISPSAYLGIRWEQRVQDTGKEVRSVVTVTGVDPSSPAGKVGIKQGDVITDFDGQGIWPEGLSAQLRKKKPGDQITIKGYRRTSNTTSVTSGSTSNFTYNVTLGTGAGK
jgi:hypothetical protein